MMAYRFLSKTWLCAFVMLLCAACGNGWHGNHKSQTSKSKPQSPIINDFVIKTTPVKNQGRSPLCWAYAMLATIESERLMMGDSVNLSPDFLARLWLQEQADEYYLTHGARQISLRGMMPMTTHLMERYGIEPYDNYHAFGNVNWNVLCRTAQQVARASASLRQLDGRVADILDQRVGYLPPSLFMFGMPYTPRQFAESVCLPDDYVFLTSFTHHPFGESFVLESADNRLLDSYMNIPIDSLMKTIVTSLRHGHPVCWEGDISEAGFSFADGSAVLNDDDKPVTQQRRQRAFERFETTDDHCMELCGLAHDNHGRRFFIVKNSWGTGNRYHGFMYLSYNYVKMKTIAVAVRKKQ